MKHTIQALVENKFGVLARIASLFSARGYNIESLAVGETQDSTVSCMTIVVDTSDEKILEQIKKQLNKLIDVIQVVDFTKREYIDKELFLAKIDKNKKDREVIDNLVKKYPVEIVEDAVNYYILEIRADRHNIDDILKELRKLGVQELARTGRLAIGK
ncbi:MAG: acetolactate synthase small subunit [Candidatus Omnitrophota bacterium]|nr:acetolactate synthase small subunit [Candidatus Omnitrophota bacterium]